MDLFGDLPEPGKNSSTLDLAVGPSPKPSKLVDLPTTKPPSHSANVTSLKRKSQDEGAPILTKKQAVGIMNLKGHFAERKGERDEMQDAHVIMDDFRSLIPYADPSVERLAYYAVFDGHAGAKAARYAAEHLHTIIATNFPKGNVSQVESEIKRCFVEAMKKTDEDFLKLATKNKPVWKDGTTAVCVLAINNTLYIANLGDSKAVLCRKSPSTDKYTALPLSADHNPTNYEERMRIQKTGGYVRDGRVMGVIEVSRSIGDGPYKRLGLICTPDIKRCQLTNNDRFIIIACDGLWKTFDNKSAIQFISTALDKEDNEGNVWDTACSQVTNEAVRKLSADNVTVVLVQIQPPS